MPSGIDITRALNTEGWMRKEALTWLAQKARRLKRIVEIGSYQGRSTLALLANARMHVWAVDTWDFGACGEEDYEAFLENTKPYEDKLTVLRMESVEAAAYLKHEFGERFFDLVFIDAAHDYEHVKRDIRAWLPLVRKNRIIAGHDYSPKTWPGVVRAVDECVGDVHLIDTIWWQHIP